MRLSFSTRGWAHLNWEEWLDNAVEMDFEGVEVYNLPKFPILSDRGAPFHKYNIAATVRTLREKKLSIPCFDTSYDISDEDLGQVCKALIQVCEKKGAVGAKEFEAVIASSAMQAPSTYHFETYTTTSSNISSAMTQIILKKQDELISGVSSGDGPIDSAFRAIEQCIGHHYELDDYQVQSVTEGKEALGSALVRLRYNGKLYSGNGTSTDIIAASIRAYINALNKIVFEEA